MMIDHFEGNSLFLVLVLILSATASWFFYHRGLLTKNGSLVTYFMALYFLGVLGWNWTLPMIVFFVTSVFFTGLHARLKKRRGWQIGAMPGRSWRMDWEQFFFLPAFCCWMILCWFIFSLAWWLQSLPTHGPVSLGRCFINAVFHCLISGCGLPAFPEVFPRWEAWPRWWAPS